MKEATQKWREERYRSEHDAETRPGHHEHAQGEIEVPLRHRRDGEDEADLERRCQERRGTRPSEPCGRGRLSHGAQT